MNRLFTMRENRDNKDIHARAIDMADALRWLGEVYPNEFGYVVIHALFHVPFRDMEEMFSLDHVSIKENFDSGIAHMTDFLNGEE